MIKELKQVAGFTPPHPQAAERLMICKGCKFHSQWMGRTWCGTPLVGDAVKVGVVDYTLCGCNMETKTKLDNSSCSIGIW